MTLGNIMFITAYDNLLKNFHSCHRLLFKFSFFSNRSVDSTSSILRYIFPMSAVLQVLIAFSIFIYRRKYEKQDGKMHEISLQPAICTRLQGENGHGTNNGFFRTNTSRYNKIMFQANNMVFIALFLVGTLIFFSLDRKYFNDVILYCQDFAPPLMLNIVFPIIFFARNKDAVLFIKKCMTCR